MKVFLGLVFDKQEQRFVHSHVAQSPDDSFFVDIWDDIALESKAIIPNSICVGEFRKWHHLVKFFDLRGDSRFGCISVFKEVPDTNLLEFLGDFKDASFF